MSAASFARARRIEAVAGPSPAAGEVAAQEPPTGVRPFATLTPGPALGGIGMGGAAEDCAAGVTAPGPATRVGVPSPLRRSGPVADELGGTAAAPEVGEALRRRHGGGRPLDPGDAERFGGPLGTDLSAVRVHTDPEADRIARSVQAMAFTHGTDIYFTQGTYSPGTGTGDHLLAHELAHVAQGSSGPSAGAAPTIGRADDPAEAAADRTADAVVGGLRRQTFADPLPVATVPGAVRRQRDPATIRRVFGKAKKLVKSLFGKAAPVDDATTGEDYMDTKTHEERMVHQRRFRGSGPGENPDYSDPALFGADPDEWRITLAVAQEDTRWMGNVKDLKKTALKELALSPRQLLGDLGDAQQRLVQKTLLGRGELDGKTEEEIQQLVDKFSDGLHEVGHTWIRLTTYAGGRLKEIYSYGMWPQKLYSPGEYAQTHGGYAGPISVGPGEVKHPDVAHEDDPTRAYKHYPLKEKEFRKALDMAVERYNSPPPYVLTGYNCTAFAREILMAAGKTYPGKGLLPGMAYTPGNLYWAIMKEWAKGKKGVATEDSTEESKGMGKLKARAGAFAEAGEANVEGEYKTTTFQLPPPGEKRRRVTLHDGARLRYGAYPTDLRGEVTLDEDTEYTIIDDPDFVDLHDCVPVEMGAQIVFIDADDFQAAAAPPKKLSQRDEFLAQGLSYWGTFRPPTDTDQPVGTWTHQEVSAKHLAEFKDPNATKDWVAVADRGEIYWVRRDHLAVFKDPTSVTFDDEAQPDQGGGSPVSAAKRTKQKAAIAKLLSQFEGLGSISVASMLSGSAITQDGIPVSQKLIAEIVREDPSYADEIAALLKCPVDDVRMDFG